VVGLVQMIDAATCLLGAPHDRDHELRLEYQFLCSFKGTPSGRASWAEARPIPCSIATRREFVKRREASRQEPDGVAGLPGSSGAAACPRPMGGSPPVADAAAAPMPRTRRRYRPQRSLSAAPARMAGPSSSRRAVSHRARSPSRARLRRVAASQRRPLTLIFPGKTSAPIRRTDQTRLGFPPVQFGQSPQVVQMMPSSSGAGESSIIRCNAPVSISSFSQISSKVSRPGSRGKW